MDKDQTLIKILSVGDVKTGKSCLIKRYCEGKFVNKYITTIGVDYGVKKMTVRARKIAINFFDLSGDKDYLDISKEFIKDAQGILLVFDLENKESFNNLSKWEKLIKDNGIDPKKSIFYLVGTKCDLKSKIDPLEISKLAKQKNYEYFQTSAVNGENVNELFEKLFNKVVDAIDDERKTLQK